MPTKTKAQMIDDIRSAGWFINYCEDGTFQVKDWHGDPDDTGPFQTLLEARDWAVKNPNSPTQMMVTALTDSLIAWEGEENSVKDEHSELIDTLRETVDSAVPTFLRERTELLAQVEHLRNAMKASCQIMNNGGSQRMNTILNARAELVTALVATEPPQARTTPARNDMPLVKTAAVSSAGRSR